MNLRNLKIGKRLFFLFVIILLAYGLSYTFFVYRLQTITSLNSQIFHKDLTSIDFLLEADRDAYQSRLALSHMVQTRSNMDYDALKTEALENLDQVMMRYNKYAELTGAAQNVKTHKLDSTFWVDYQNMKLITDSIVHLAASNREHARNLYFEDYAPYFDTMRESINKSTEILMEAAADDNLHINAISKEVMNIVVILAIAIILFLLGGAWFVTRSITIPLGRLVNYSERLAKGDLNFTIETVGNDEITTVFRAYKQMLDVLRKVILGIRNNATELANASVAISSVSQNIAQGSNTQAVSTEEIAAAIEEIASSIRENAANSEEAERVAKRAAAQIIEGRTTMNETASAMKEIKEKIAIVNEIAVKTDLLAINAAIEAGRAGHSGKGFSVVATEVRKLAETSNRAAKLIDELIKTNAEKVIEFSEELSRIAENVEISSRAIQEISSSSYEQQSSSAQVNIAVQQLNSTTQQNSATAEELSTSAEQLESQAENLRRSIDFFVLENSENDQKIKSLKIQVRELLNAIDTLTSTDRAPSFEEKAKKREKSESTQNHVHGVHLDISESDNMDTEFKEF